MTTIANLHLDKRAAGLASSLAGDSNDLLSTSQVAELLGVSHQWLEIGRMRGYGPSFIRLSTRKIRYRRDQLLAWLRSRAVHRSTSEYRKAEERFDARQSL